MGEGTQDRRLGPGLSIVIVSWNAESVLAACLQSLVANPPCRHWEVLVVDNASSDDSVRIAREFGGPVRVVELDTNLGFAGAANEGFHRSQEGYLLFLNSDVRARSSSLENLGRFLDSHPEASAAAGKLLGDDGAPQKGFNVRAFPTVASAALEILLVDKIFPKNPISRRQRMLDFSFADTVEVEQPAGACLLVRREAFEAVGLFDTRFHPAWFEDVDLCLRLRRQGHRIFFVADAQFDHRGGASLEVLSYPEFLSFWYSNLLRFFEKHHGSAAKNFLRALVAVGMLERALAATLLGPKPGLDRREALTAYWQVLRDVL